MAKRYIDADKLDFSPLEDGFDRARAVTIVKFAPTADVVEVVRCKDCKHQEQCCEFIMISGKDKNIDFCSYGERRTDDDTL